MCHAKDAQPKGRQRDARRTPEGRQRRTALKAARSSNPDPLAPTSGTVLRHLVFFLGICPHLSVNFAHGVT